MKAKNLKVGFFNVTKKLNNDAFRIIIADDRISKSVIFFGLPLITYDDLLASVNVDTSIGCLGRLVEKFKAVHHG